jgi:UDP-3-O-[3-hydroxymyristoyl] glucosamine N-acyltransferase
MEYSLRIIAEKVGAQIAGGGDEVIRGVNALETAQAGELTFAQHARMAAQVGSTNASAIIVSNDFPLVAGKNLLRVGDPRLAFIKVMTLFQTRQQAPAGVHPAAVVSPEAELSEGVAVAECAVVREQARIGARTVIESGVHIGREVAIGADCAIGPNVVIMHGTRLGDRVIVHPGTVIGGDGFGYNWSEGRHAKIPQLGNVVIEDDVEIGCNVCVDRATFGSTIIRRGTKIDNLVQIAHNDVIGEDVIITGQVGLSGSVTVGNRVMFGGQSGVVDHITIGDDAQIGAGSPVIKDVPPRQVVWGFPARPVQRAKRELATLARLPRTLEQLRKLGLLRKRETEPDG